MLEMRKSGVIFSHIHDNLKEAATIWAHDPFTITGRICWKSPPKTGVMPPNCGIVAADI
jgi:hypothetical protein